MFKKALSRVVLPVVTLAAAVLVNPGAAQASGYTCAWSHGVLGSTCMYVNGTSNWVEDTTIEHGHTVEWPNYCELQARATYTITNGATWQNYSSLRSGCYVYLSILIKIRMYAYDPSYFYGEAKHDGAWAPGVPRLTISA